MESCCSRFTAAEGGARLAAAAGAKNIMITEHTNFIPTSLLIEHAHRIRGSLKSGYQRSIYLTRASKIDCIAHELKILTDLVISGVKSYDDVQDWRQELEEKQVIVCTTSVFKQILVGNMLDMLKINVLIIDSCHLVFKDDNLRYIMKLYKNCDVYERPRILAMTYPLFQSSRDDEDGAYGNEQTNDECEKHEGVNEISNDTISDDVMQSEKEINDINDNSNDIRIDDNANDRENNECANNEMIKASDGGSSSDIKEYKGSDGSDEICERIDVDITTDNKRDSENLQEHDDDKNSKSTVNYEDTPDLEVKETVTRDVKNEYDDTEGFNDKDSEIKDNETNNPKISDTSINDIESRERPQIIDVNDLGNSTNGIELNSNDCDVTNDANNQGRVTTAKEMAVYENSDDFEMYEKLEWRLEELERELCCEMDLAEDIDGGKRLSPSITKPKEVIIEFEKAPREPSDSYIQLDKFMRDTINEAMEFINEHRYDPTEIYGEELYEEFMNIPHPTIEPKQLFHQFLFVLDELGPYAADKAAFSLLSRLEKLKIKVPYERHFLLLCLCTSVFVKIRCYADLIFSSCTSDWEKLTSFSTPKVLRFAAILEEFQPESNDRVNDDKPNEDNKMERVDDVVNESNDATANGIDRNIVESVCDIQDSCKAVGNNDATINDGVNEGKPIDDSDGGLNENADIVNEDDANRKGMKRSKTIELLDEINECNFAALGDKIEDRVNLIEMNLKDIINEDEDAKKTILNSEDVCDNALDKESSRVNNNEYASNKDDTETNNVSENDSATDENNSEFIRENSEIATNSDNATGNLNDNSEVTNSDTARHDNSEVTNNSDKVDSVGEAKVFKRGRGRGRGRPRVNTKVQQQQNSDSLCGIVFLKEPLMAKILFMIIVDMSRSRGSLAHLCAQYCAVEGADEPRESQRQGRKQEDVLKKFRMHECNLLLATSALEEGIDLPRCNLVVRWDVPSSYRSHGLCRSRARASKSSVALLADADRHSSLLVRHLAVYKELDQIVTRKCGCGIQNEPTSEEEIEADTYTQYVKAYTPKDDVYDKSMNDDMADDGVINIEKQTKELDEVKTKANDTDVIVGNNENEINDKHKDAQANNDAKVKGDNDRNDDVIKIEDRETAVQSDKVSDSTVDVLDFRDGGKISVQSVTHTKSSANNGESVNLKVSDGVCACKSEAKIGSDLKVSYEVETKGDVAASVDLNSAIALINRYCGKLPSDTFTRLAPQWWMEQVQLPMGEKTQTAYICTLRMPLNCPVKYNIVGHPMPTRVLARRMVALQACRILHKSGELDDQLMPIGKENFKAAELDSNISTEFSDNGDSARPGTTKRRQYYYKRTAWAFTDCQPIIDTTDAEIEANPVPQHVPVTGNGKRNTLHALVSGLWCALPERYNTRGRRLHLPQHAAQALGVLLRAEPDRLQIPAFPVYTRSGEVRVSVEPALEADVRLSPRRDMLIRRFMRFVFSDVLRVRRRGMKLETEGSTQNNYYIVPTVKRTKPDGTTMVDIDWAFLELIYKHTEDKKREELSWKDNGVDKTGDKTVDKTGDKTGDKSVDDSADDTVDKTMENAVDKVADVTVEKNVKVAADTIGDAVVDKSVGKTVDRRVENDHTASRESLHGRKGIDKNGDKRGDKTVEKRVENPLLAPGEVFKFDPQKYSEAVVTPWYRNQDQPQFFLVAEICWHLTPDSSFPSDQHATFRSYYRAKYGAELTQSDQPLLDVDHTSARLNLLTPRYVNRKGVALPVSSERTRRAKRDRLDQKQIMVPELCRVHPFAAPLWAATVALPCVLYRINALLIADEIRRAVAVDVGLGIPRIDDETCPGFTWPPLDFGWSLAEVLSADSEKHDKKRDTEDWSKNDEPEKEEVMEERVTTEKSEAEPEEVREKTINDILQEKEDAESGFEIGTWSNDMASSIPPTPDEFSEPLPHNVTLCTSATGGVNWSEPIQKPKAFNAGRTFSMADSDCSYMSSDFDTDDSDLNTEGSDDDSEGFCSSKNTNAAMGVRIEYKTAHEAEAVDVERKRPVAPAPSPDAADAARDLAQCRRLLRGGRPPAEHIEKFRKSVEIHEREIIENGHLITKDKPIVDLLPDVRETDKQINNDIVKIVIDKKQEIKVKYVSEHKKDEVSLHKDLIIEEASFGNPTDNKEKASMKSIDIDSIKDLSKDNIDNNLVTDGIKDSDSTVKDRLMHVDNKAIINVHVNKLIELHPYLNGVQLQNGQITLESIERNKRKLLAELKGSLTDAEIKKLNCFSMKDIDIDAPDYVNEKIVNVGFDSKERYAKVASEWRDAGESRPYYMDGACQSCKEFDFDYQPNLEGHPGPSPSVILQALTMSNANDGINLERLETIGDSFLKFAITAYLYCAHPAVHEGKLSHMRSKQVSNLNLYRLGRNKRLGARMIASKFEPHDNWLPPCHKPPPTLQPGASDDQEAKEKSVKMPVDNTGCFIPYNLITQHSIPDKSIADCVEALIGAYLLECGPRGALLFMSWLGIRVLPRHLVPLPDDHPYVVKRSATVEPPPDDWGWRARRVGSLRPRRDASGRWLQPIFGELKAPPSPLLRYIDDPEGELEQMLSGYEELERTLQYRFRDRSLLLQALTHASHQKNRLTDCYQRLEFLGDAILDYLITRHLYEDARRHSPGALTDLRSALVNNTIFATLAARHGFHKYFRHMSPGLNEVLTKYVKIQEENGHSISEEHYLIQEDELEQAEDVEVPKALGDLFESVAGAIFLDSGMSLGAVWRSYARLMVAELDAFSAAAPKSPVRELLEAEPDTAKFGKPERLADGRRVRVCVEVFGRGTFKGVGRNYRIAKGTAARCALRHLRGCRVR
ncbi:endoribonuclease Dcr-1 [Zerene cesonia]|uniref:endoribonuclease Dcr-1 n=1 Tax=Zerene cesonia TaxID=33412 RepID=UPI0018E53B68|nr:endoribonuclease Dcr-1 [Zerene cesonia]